LKRELAEADKALADKKRAEKEEREARLEELARRKEVLVPTSHRNCCPTRPTIEASLTIRQSLTARQSATRHAIL